MNEKKEKKLKKATNNLIKGINENTIEHFDKQKEKVIFLTEKESYNQALADVEKEIDYKIKIRQIDIESKKLTEEDFNLYRSQIIVLIELKAKIKEMKSK